MARNNNNIVIGIAGSGGDGVISAGEILVNAASSDGLFVFMLKSYGAQIRGGESSVRVRMSSEPVATQEINWIFWLCSVGRIF